MTGPDLILAGRYGWTPSQIDALPPETRDLLLSLPPPLPAPSREGRFWRWVTKPRASAAHLLGAAAWAAILIWLPLTLLTALAVTGAVLGLLGATAMLLDADRRERTR